MENYKRYAIIRFLNENNQVCFDNNSAASLNEVGAKWQRALPILKGKKLNLYVHIPFCARKCRYCYCVSRVPKSGEEVENYLKTLKREMDHYSPVFRNAKFGSLWIGGGTPSYLSKAQLEKLFDAIYSNFSFADNPQVNIEISPATMDREKADVLGRNRVNRVTLGIQSTDDKVLGISSRVQSNEQVRDTVKWLRETGIGCINTDIMCGIEGQTVESFQRTLKDVISLGPNIVHMFSFLDSPSTEFHKCGKRIGKSDYERIKEMKRAGREMLNKAGYRNEKYEEGFVKGVDSMNLADHDFARFNASILGIGEGARSHIFNSAWCFHQGYGGISEKNVGDISFFYAKSDTEKEIKLYIFQNIKHGIIFAEFEKLFGKDLMDAYGKEIEFLERKGVVERRQDSIILAKRGHRLVVAAQIYDEKDAEEMQNTLNMQYSPSIDYGKALRGYLKTEVID